MNAEAAISFAGSHVISSSGATLRFCGLLWFDFRKLRTQAAT
jgi:hypothetical protein